MSVQQAIRLLYGHSLATQLIETNISSDKPENPDNEDSNDDEAMDVDLPSSTNWSAELHFSNANYQAKKTTFLLFINRE